MTGDALTIIEEQYTEAQNFRAETLISHEKVIESIESQIQKLEAESHEHIIDIRFEYRVKVSLDSQVICVQ